MSVFIKQNTSPYPDSLLKEADGLALLQQHLQHTNNTDLQIPDVIHCDTQQLQLPLIEQHSATPQMMSMLGTGLAQLHQTPQAHYGLGTDNYIGLSIQKNTITDNWGVFFADYRLTPQIEMIQQTGVREAFQQTLQKHRQTLIDVLNQYCEYPSLLHGDLWSGNVLFEKEKVWLIDPAVYYGDAEADIAMTEMFGGFTEDFYMAYQSILPFTEAYPLKRKLYNLYHALNHYNLFGSHYLPQCQQGFDAITSL